MEQLKVKFPRCAFLTSFVSLFSLSSLSSVDMERFKATVVNNSSKSVFEKPERESPRSSSVSRSQFDIDLKEVTQNCSEFYKMDKIHLLLSLVTTRCTVTLKVLVFLD